MRITTTAARLNAMIQTHVEARRGGEYPWHTDVYLHDPDATGCNWNVEVNCNHSVVACGAIISPYLDMLRTTYVIPANDATAVTSYDTRQANPRRHEPSWFAADHAATRARPTVYSHVLARLQPDAGPLN